MDEHDGTRLRDGERALLLFGVGSLFVLALTQFLRRVDTVEVITTVLFGFIFVALVMFDVVGGAVAAAVATIVYLVLRLAAVDIIGSGAMFRLVLSRALVFFAFGILGGMAHRLVYQALRKLDDVDVVDDLTGMANARSFVRDLDFEIARSNRYKHVFSVSYVDLATEQFAALKPAQRRTVLGEFGTMLRESVRTTDRLAVSHDGGFLRLIVLLPETGPEGREVFTTRFVERISSFLLNRGVALPRKAGAAVTYPEQGNDIRRLRNEVARAAGLPLTVDLSRR